MICALQLNVRIRQLHIIVLKQVQYCISICFSYCFCVTKYIHFSKVDQPVQTSYKMPMQVWIFCMLVLGDHSLSSMLLFSGQISTVTHFFFFFFCTLLTENIKTQNFFLFPKQEVTYNQSSRGKKFGIWKDGQSLVSQIEISRKCGCRGRAELVGPGEQCGFYSENHDQTMKGFKHGVNMI